MLESNKSWVLGGSCVPGRKRQNHNSKFISFERAWRVRGTGSRNNDGELEQREIPASNLQRFS